jgi:exosortase
MDNQISAPAIATIENQSAVSNVGVLEEFQTDLIAFWRELPNKGFFFGLLAAWLLIFQFWGNSILGYIHTPSLFSWLTEAYNSNKQVADDSIGSFIPFVVLGLMWWKRKELLATSPKIWIPAMLVVLLAMVFHLAGYVAQEPRISIVALFVGIYGLMGLSWGFRWLQRSFFPFFLFVFSVPLGNHSDFITFRLRLLVCQLVEFISHTLLGIGIIRQGTQLSDPSGSYQYEVAAACSGIRSLFIILLLSIVYSFVVFRSFWKRVLLISMAFPLAVLGNLLRMMCIVIAAEIGGKSWGDFVHENPIISLVPYVPVILGLFYVGGWLEKLEQRSLTEGAVRA